MHSLSLSLLLPLLRSSLLLSNTRNIYSRIAPCLFLISSSLRPPLSSPNTPNLMFFFVYFPFVDFFYIFILSLISSHASYFPSQLSPPPSLILHLSRSLSSFLYTLSVRYDLKQPCVPLGRGRCQGPPSLVALTPDTHTVAVACGSDIEIFACVTGEVVATIASAHQRMCVGS